MKNNFIGKLSGSAILLSIIFSILLLLITFGLISLSERESKRSVRALSFLQFNHLVDEQLKLGIASKYFNIEQLNFPDGFSGQVKSRIWGGYEMIESIIYYKEDTLSKSCLIGGNPTGTALLLNPEIRTLFSSQNVRVNGGVNMHRSNIHRIPFNSSNDCGINFNKYKNEVVGSITGELERVESYLKAQEYEIDKIIRGLGGLGYQANSSVDYSNSFGEELKIIKFQEDTVSNVSISGNVLMWSEGRITIDSSAKLTDVWVVAKEISVLQGFKGNIHLTATSKIMIDSLVELGYPSSLNIHGGIAHEPALAIGSKSTLFGIIFGTKLTRDAFLNISPESFIDGDIVWTQKAQVMGRVHGLCYISEPLLVSESTYKEHFLHDLVISPSDSNPYRLTPIHSKENKPKVLQWLVN